MKIWLDEIQVRSEGGHLEVDQLQMFILKSCSESFVQISSGFHEIFSLFSPDLSREAALMLTDFM